MSRILDYFSLCRPYQWYKNLLVYLALLFSGMLFEIASFNLVTLAFISLSMISSSSYIINDIIDIRRDRMHPEKKKRPIAAGKVRSSEALILSAILVVISLTLAFALSYIFALIVATIFLLTQLYTLVLKDEPFLEAIMVSMNHVLRAVSGAIVLSVVISPWLIISTFSLALLLVFSKRRGEQIFLGKDAPKHRPVHRKYSPQMLSSIMYISATLFILSYVFYSFLLQDQIFLLTLPILLYAVFYYLSLVESGSSVGRNSHMVFKEPRMLASMFIFTSVVVGMIYV